MTTTYKFKAGYTKNGTATAPSAAPTLNIVNMATDALLLTAGTPTASVNMPGLYSYSYSSGTASLDLVGLFHTTDATMDGQDIFSVPDLVAAYYTSLGTGSTSTSIVINDGTNPLDGVDVWATTDAAGANVVARGYTNSSGSVTFYLDAGTYYIWKTLSRYAFTNPSTLTVT